MGRCERKGEGRWSDVGICSYVPEYILLCGLEYHVGLSTDDSAQENLCATHSRRVFVFWRVGIYQSQSMGQSTREHVSVQVYA